MLIALATAEFRTQDSRFAGHAREVYLDLDVDPLTRAQALLVSQPLAGHLPASDRDRDIDVAEQVVASLDLEDPAAADAAAALRAIINVARSLSAPRDISEVRAAIAEHPVESRGQRSMLATLVYEAAISGRASAEDCVAPLRRALTSEEGTSDVTENVADTQGLLVLIAADDLPTLDVVVRRGLARGRADNFGHLHAMYLGLSCATAWARGELVGAEADGRAALATEGIVDGIAMSIAFPLVRVLLDRGETDAAEELLASFPLESAPLLGRAGLVLASAMLRLAQARWEEAAEARGFRGNGCRE